MKYCIYCGAEITEEAGFCGKCGNPVGKTPEQRNRTKKRVMGISAGVVLMAVTLGILFAAGIIGGEGESVQSGADGQECAYVPEGLVELMRQNILLSAIRREKSKESADLSTLDSVANALAAAVANAGGKGNAGWGMIRDISTISESDGIVQQGIIESLGGVSEIRMVSVAGKNKPVRCSWDESTQEIKVWCGKDGGEECRYLKDDDGNKRRLISKNK